MDGVHLGRVAKDSDTAAEGKDVLELGMPSVLSRLRPGFALNPWNPVVLVVEVAPGVVEYQERLP